MRIREIDVIMNMTPNQRIRGFKYPDENATGEIGYGPLEFYLEYDLHDQYHKDAVYIRGVPPHRHKPSYEPKYTERVYLVNTKSGNRSSIITLNIEKLMGACVSLAVEKPSPRRLTSKVRSHFDHSNCVHEAVPITGKIILRLMLRNMPKKWIGLKFLGTNKPNLRELYRYQTNMDDAIDNRVGAEPELLESEDKHSKWKVEKEYAYEKVARIREIIDSMIAIFYTHWYESNTTGMKGAR